MLQMFIENAVYETGQDNGEPQYADTGYNYMSAIFA